MWKRKQKHFEERSWKRKQTQKRLTLYGAESGSKKYFTVFTSLIWNHDRPKVFLLSYKWMQWWSKHCFMQLDSIQRYSTVELLFSMGNDILRPKRYRMTDKQLEMLLFMRTNQYKVKLSDITRVAIFCLLKSANRSCCSWLNLIGYGTTWLVLARLTRTHT